MVYINAWQHFVSACWILCQRTITQGEIRLAEFHVHRFCKRISTPTREYDTKIFRCKFGIDMLKVNPHLAACHLADMLRDYGPMCGYWAFPLERFDGLAADVHANGRNIEVSI